MKTLKFQIQGMTCPHCQMRVSNAISGVEGVAVEKIDLTSAEVNLEDITKKDDIIAAVKSAGYSVTAVQEI
ncbi:MAG: heavy-metal-associated domain-containing protein [Bacteroidetes bacterium]|nr:heavy-metal-associated domain-containing protein [Bacteroidota bacterium]